MIRDELYSIDLKYAFLDFNGKKYFARETFLYTELVKSLKDKDEITILYDKNNLENSSMSL